MLSVSLLALFASATGTSLLSLRGGAKKEKVAIIGSGNWGSAIAKIIGRNVIDRGARLSLAPRRWHTRAPPFLVPRAPRPSGHMGVPDEFDTEVRMWVYEEQVDGKNLTQIINTEHENVKYLPVREHAFGTRAPGAQLCKGLCGYPDSAHSRTCAPSPPSGRVSSSPRTSLPIRTWRAHARMRLCLSSCCRTSSLAASAPR